MCLERVFIIMCVCVCGGGGGGGGATFMVHHAVYCLQSNLRAAEIFPNLTMYIILLSKWKD